MAEELFLILRQEMRVSRYPHKDETCYKKHQVYTAGVTKDPSHCGSLVKVDNSASEKSSAYGSSLPMSRRYFKMIQEGARESMIHIYTVKHSSILVLTQVEV